MNRFSIINCGPSDLILLLTTFDVQCRRKVTLIINKEELEKLGDAPKVRVA
jgi:hypothetical protein